ncbi:hypothetical protein H8D85_00800 [bacterium]|nr:hypothetical protein [bacterium]
MSAIGFSCYIAYNKTNMEHMWKVIGMAALVALGQAVTLLATQELNAERIKIEKDSQKHKT